MQLYSEGQLSPSGGREWLLLLVALLRKKGRSMNVLSRDDLTTLLEGRPGWHISMFMPMMHRGAETQQNPIRWKTLLRQAEDQLLALGVRPQEAQDLVQPVQQLLGDHTFWQRQNQGLALFLAPQLLREYRVPLPL